MVSQSSKKKAKFTYAERVVGALTQLQRDHRKSAVHLATLRAQVRKAAQERKDKLGPQWSSWVSKAVDKLAEQGVVESNHSGAVCFTPEAKKTLATARRESSIAPHAADPIALDIQLSKKLSHKNFGQGKKRRRRSSVTVPQHDSDDDEEPTTAASKSQRSKRARRQSRRKTIDTTTRQELQVNHIEPADGSLQHESEEIAHLKEQLVALRHEYDELKATRPGDVNLDSASANRPRTPDHTLDRTFDFTAAYPATPAPRSNARGGQLSGVMRTESGTLIDLHSKQATPAPSATGSRDYDMEEEDHFELPPSEDLDRRDHEGIFGISHGLATPPMSSPYADRIDRRVSSRQDEELASLREARNKLEQEVEQLKSFVLSRGERAKALETQLNEKAALLSTTEADIVANRARIQQLEGVISDLQGSNQTKEAALSIALVDVEAKEAKILLLTTEKERQLLDRQTQLTDLQVQLDAADTRAGNAEAERIRVKTLAEMLTGENEKLMQVKAGLEHEVSRLQSELDVKLKDLLSIITLRDNLESRCTTLQGELVEKDNTIGKLQEQLKASEEHEQLLLSQRAHVDANIVAANGELVELKNTVASLETALQHSNKALEESKGSEESLKNELASSQAAHQAEAVVLQTSVNDYQRQLKESEGVVEREKRLLREALHEAEILSTQLEEQQKAIANLQACRDEALQQETQLLSDLGRANVKISELELTVDETGERLQKQEAWSTKLQAELETTTDARAALLEKLTGAETQRADLLKQVVENAETISTLEMDITALRSTESNLRLKVDETVQQHATESAAARVHIATLQENILEIESQVQDWKTRTESSENSRQALASQLVASQEETGGFRDCLETEKAHALRLTHAIERLKTSMAEAEEEIEELREAKVQDEASITLLRDAYAGLRKTQMDSLAEVDDKISSVHSTPLPRRRCSGALSSSHVGPSA